MKHRLLLTPLFFLIFMFCNAQNMIKVTSVGSHPATLNGKAKITFTSSSNDMVITTNQSRDMQKPNAMTQGNRFVYELLLDVSNRNVKREITLSKKGTTYNDRISVVMQANYQYNYDIQQVENVIDIVDNPNVPKGYNDAKDGIALILIDSKVKLKVEAAKLKNFKVRSGRSNHDTYIDTLFIDTREFRPIKIKLDSLANLSNELDEKIDDSRLKDDEIVDIRVQKEKVDEEMYPIPGQLQEIVSIKLSAPKTNDLYIPTEDVLVLVTKAIKGYSIRVLNETKTIERALTYQEVLANAKERYKEYPMHTDLNFYEAALTAYDKLLAHNDCPTNLRQEYQTERDSLASMRKWVKFHEKANALIKDKENSNGFDAPDVYQLMNADLRFVKTILEYHPEITGYKSIEANLEERIEKHPSSKKIVEEVKTIQRQTISGTVSYKNKNIRIPLNTLKVFATNSSKTDPSGARLIGGVSADGTFKVVKPDDMQYIFITGEKGNAHYISEDTNYLEIIL